MAVKVRRETVPHFIDKAGNAVKAGDTVVYPVSPSHSVSLRFGRVYRVERVHGPYSQPDWSIGVVSVDDTYGENWPTWAGARGPVAKVNLRFPNRILLWEGDVPDWVRRLLDKEAP